MVINIFRWIAILPVSWVTTIIVYYLAFVFFPNSLFATIVSLLSCGCIAFGTAPTYKWITSIIVMIVMWYVAYYLG
jgi:hypothetical protein